MLVGGGQLFDGPPGGAMGRAGFFSYAALRRGGETKERGRPRNRAVRISTYIRR